MAEWGSEGTGGHTGAGPGRRAGRVVCLTSAGRFGEKDGGGAEAAGEAEPPQAACRGRVRRDGTERVGALGPRGDNGGTSTFPSRCGVPRTLAPRNCEACYQKGSAFLRARSLLPPQPCGFPHLLHPSFRRLSSLSLLSPMLHCSLEPTYPPA